MQAALALAPIAILLSLLIAARWSAAKAGAVAAAVAMLMARPMRSLPPDLRQRTTTHLRYGETQSVLMKIADELGADLVVIGTHGRSGFSEAVFASIAEAVLRCVTPGTMVIREPTRG